MLRYTSSSLTGSSYYTVLETRDDPLTPGRYGYPIALLLLQQQASSLCCLKLIVRETASEMLLLIDYVVYVDR